MTLSRTHTLVPTALLVLSFCAFGCKSKSTEDQSASASSASSAAALTPEMQARVDAVAGSADTTTWTFTPPLADSEAIELSVLVAKAHKVDAATGAALSTLARVLKKESPSPEVIDVIVENLASSTPRLAVRALGAATPLLSSGRADRKVIEAVSQLSLQDEFRDGKGRYALLEAIRQAPVAMRRGRFEEILLSSLKASEPFVVIAALQLLDDDKAEPKRDAKLEAAFFPLAERGDPAVRGVALRSLAHVSASGSERTQGVLLPALKDENAFVRSQACIGLGQTGSASAVPALIPLLDDLGDSRQQYYATSFEREKILKALTSSYWPHVADAAQYAVQRLAPKAPRVEPAKPKDVTGSLKQNAKVLKAWYAKNKASFPPTSVTDAAPKGQGAKSAVPSTQQASAKSDGPNK